jgi:hypothetical protein
MPKLSNDDYLIRHEILHRVWGTDNRHFTHLKYQQQRDLHDYYDPAKDLTNDELLAHRKKVAKQHPSLPQRASKAFLVMLRPETQREPAHSSLDRKGRKITIRPLVRPEIDTEQLARALLRMAEQLTPEERAKLVEKYGAEEKRAA